MQVRYASLNVAYSFSPPFGVVSPQEDVVIVDQINQSEARILFVGLGCPKQEIWMAEHADRVNAVIFGVGAAFDFHAGISRRHLYGCRGWDWNGFFDWQRSREDYGDGIFIIILNSLYWQ